MSNGATALHHAEAGLHVFPADTETKRPLVRFTAAATKMTAGAHYFWQRYGADALPCIHLSAAGLVVIDLDRGHDADVDGVAEFDRLLDLYGELPSCPAVRTPRGGVHLYFRQPSGREPLGNSTSRIAPGVDIRGFHGYTVAPGAVMATGEFYEAIAGTPDLAYAFAAGTIPEIPTWLAELAAAPKAPDMPARGPSSPITDRRLRPWAWAALEYEAAALACTPTGTRNRRLFKAVANVAGKGGAHGVISEAEAYEQLWTACVANGSIADDGAKQFRDTFNSGWRKGLSNPHPGPRERLTQTIDPRFAGLMARAK